VVLHFSGDSSDGVEFRCCEGEVAEFEFAGADDLFQRRIPAVVA